jgi:hypothetical protein
MATVAEHLSQAKHNQSFLETIDRPDYPDWLATVAFYKALHLVEAMFRVGNHKTGSHLRRNNILRKHYLSVWREYKTLYSFARLARYRCLKVKPTDVDFVM